MRAKKQRLLSPLLLWFMGTMILANIAARMIFPLESLYVQQLGASVEQVQVSLSGGSAQRESQKPIAACSRR